MAFDTAVIYIRGYIGHTVTEIKTDKGGKKYCSFSICAVTGKGRQTWYQCKVYGDIGINLVNKKRIIKGMEAMVKGVPSMSTWKDGNGNTKINFNIFCDWVSIQEKVLDKVEYQRDLEYANEINESIPDEVIQSLNNIDDLAPF